ncbi:MAG: urea transporter [Alistipes sp.]|nr:urea transporter [Alistipes sp.]
MAHVNGIKYEDVGNIFSLNFIKVMLRGTGQVMFQNSTWAGFFILCGIFWGAYEEGQGLVAWGAVVGLLVSTLTGHLLALPNKDGDQGLWGFNGILVGCAFMTFLGNTIFSWLALIFCSAMTVWVRAGFNNVMAPWKVNSFTMPFVFTTWLFLLSARVMKGMPPEFMSTPELPGNFSSDLSLAFGDLVIYWLKGVAQVFLINSWVTGALFLIGLTLSNKWAGIWAAIASAVALFIIIVFRGPGSDIANGLYGFSPVLTGIALGMTFYKVNRLSALWCLVGIIATVFVQAGLNVFLTPLGLPALTAPFCITTWLFLLPLFKFNVKSEREVDHSNWDRKKQEKEKEAQEAAEAVK